MLIWVEGSSTGVFLFLSLILCVYVCVPPCLYSSCVGDTCCKGSPCQPLCRVSPQSSSAPSSVFLWWVGVREGEAGMPTMPPAWTYPPSRGRHQGSAGEQMVPGIQSESYSLVLVLVKLSSLQIPVPGCVLLQLTLIQGVSHHCVVHRVRLLHHLALAQCSPGCPSSPCPSPPGAHYIFQTQCELESKYKWYEYARQEAEVACMFTGRKKWLSGSVMPDIQTQWVVNWPRLGCQIFFFQKQISFLYIAHPNSSHSNEPSFYQSWKWAVT